MGVAVLRDHGVVGQHLAGGRIGPLAPEARQPPRLTVGAGELPGCVHVVLPIGLDVVLGGNDAALATTPGTAKGPGLRHAFAPGVEGGQALALLALRSAGFGVRRNNPPLAHR